MSNLLVVGDIHGQFDVMRYLLIDQARVMDAAGQWTGADSTLCFVGDYVDRGPDGIGCIDLIQALEPQALAVGGRVIALLGNHDVGFVAAQLFPDKRSSGPAGTFRRDWQRNGGMARDLMRLRGTHMDWLRSRSAMALVQGKLIVHADSLLYYRYGKTIEDVNRAFYTLLNNENVSAWDRLLDDFSTRGVFLDASHVDRFDRSGVERARQFLRTYGGTQLIHGHTPIAKMSDLLPEEVERPLVYADGLCVNVDGGLYMGGRGFVYKTPL